jgi:predicted phage terminase large subunit-like protein
VARRWGRAIRDDVTIHEHDLGFTVRDDLSAQSEWQIKGHEGGVYTAGVGGALTGRPVDLLIIDDPIKDRVQADSKVFRDRAWDWWTDVASTRLAPGAPVILILTRWHHDDLAGRLLTAADGALWNVVNIPAQADTDTDPLGREPGAFMESARGRTAQQWEAIKVRSGPRTWASLYQGHPTPDEGGLFNEDVWGRYDNPLWIVRDDGSKWIPTADEVCQSWDFAFKGHDKADYVVGQVWARVGVTAYLVDQVHERLNFTQTLAAIKRMSAVWPQATAKFMEDKANGPAIINSLSRELVGLIPVEPEGSKYARAEAISPLVHSGNVVLPEASIAPWISDLTQEAQAFPNGTHDDQVDALTQAINRILLMPLQAETLLEPDEFDEVEARGWAISPY